MLASPAWGQEEEPPTYGWSDTADLSYVLAGGNSEASTLGLRNSLVRTWKEATFTLEAGALRAETTATSRVARGTADSFRVDETTQTAVSAEHYFLRGRYDRTISEHLFWFAGGGWDRNEPAGVKDRLYGVGGIGNTWFDDEQAHFRTNYGITYTRQKDVFEAPGGSDGYIGLQLGWDYRRQLGAATTYANALTIDANADETSDYRADMTNSVAVSMSDKLAIKVSLQLLYDNMPSLTSVPLETADGVDTGITVLTPLDELDTLLHHRPGRELLAGFQLLRAEVGRPRQLASLQPWRLRPVQLAGS